VAGNWGKLQHHSANAVALAGFAGVVVVFRRESVHDWSSVDKFRLRLLFANSILPLGLA
jgi:hypothetical protein